MSRKCEFQDLNQNFSIVKCFNSQKWFREIPITFPKVKFQISFSVILPAKLKSSVLDASNFPSVWGIVQEAWSLISHFSGDFSIEFTILP